MAHQMTQLQELQLEHLTTSADEVEFGIPLKHLSKRCPLDERFLTIDKVPANVSSKCALGAFCDLPTEIIHLLFEFTDIQTLTNLRTVNSTFLVMLDNTSMYKNLRKLAPNVVRVLIGSGMARQTPLRDVCLALQSDRCIICNQFGAWFNVLVCGRVCQYCASHEERLLPSTAAQASERFALSANLRDDIPRFYPVSGELKHKDRCNFLRSQSKYDDLEERLIHVMKCAGMSKKVVDDLDSSRHRGTFFSKLRAIEQHQGSVNRWTRVKEYTDLLQKLAWAANQVALVDVGAAKIAAEKQHGSIEKAEERRDNKRQRISWIYEQAAEETRTRAANQSAQWHIYRRRKGKKRRLPKQPSVGSSQLKARNQRPLTRPRFPPYTQDFDNEGSDPRRLAVVIQVPWIDFKTGDSDPGHACNGCKQKSQMMSMKEWREHFQSCQAAQVMWDEWKEQRICA